MSNRPPQVNCNAGAPPSLEFSRSLLEFKWAYHASDLLRQTEREFCFYLLSASAKQLWTDFANWGEAVKCDRDTGKNRRVYPNYAMLLAEYKSLWEVPTTTFDLADFVGLCVCFPSKTWGLPKQKFWNKFPWYSPSAIVVIFQTVSLWGHGTKVQRPQGLSHSPLGHWRGVNNGLLPRKKLNTKLRNSTALFVSYSCLLVETNCIVCHANCRKYAAWLLPW